MESKILAWCREQRLFEPGAEVCCAVSGGADSTAMLVCLLALRGELKITVRAAHYNHRLRGAESDRDEAFVRSLCERLGVPLTVSGGDVAARARETGESVEEAARKLRYAFLEGLGCTVATAHNADDNAETVLLNLVRGTALRGLCGIPPKRGPVVRPMLCVTRREIEGYLLEKQLPHVEDSTNAEPDALRNRLRLEVLPLLRRENPSLSGTLLRGSLLLRQDEDYLERLAHEALAAARQDGGWSCAALLAQPEAVRTRAVRAMLAQIAAPKLTFAHIRAVDALLASENPSAEVSLPGGWTARRQYGLLTLIRRAKAPGWTPVRLTVDGVTELPALGLRISCSRIACLEKNPQNQNSPSTFVCRCDMIDKIPELWARPRASQDALRLPGGRRTLKRLMIDRKIPAAQRGLLPVIVDEAGILGVCGIGPDTGRLAQEGFPAIRICIEQTEK